MLEKAPVKNGDTSILHVGVGFINWGVDLQRALEAFEDHVAAMAWLFAPKKLKISSNGQKKPEA